MLKKIKNSFIGFLLGIITTLLSVWFFFLRQTGNGQKSLESKASQVDQKIKKQEKHLDLEKSKEAREDIEKKVKKRKEDLNEKDISELTNMFNNEFSR